MKREDFGPREIFFLLSLAALATGLVWYATWAFWAIMQFIASAELVIGFIIFGLFYSL